MKNIFAIASLTLALTGSFVHTTEAKSRHHHTKPVIESVATTTLFQQRWDGISMFEKAVREPVLALTKSASRTFSGIASFYGNEVGNKTASGQRFNQNAMTAAHRSLPFGTKVRVTHGSRSVVVTINDRGPFIRGRVIDLSKGAASAIGLTSRGVGHVVAEVM